MIQVIAVTDAVNHIGATQVLPGKVENHTAPNLTVGDNQYTVIDRHDGGVHEVHLLHCAFYLSRRDEITGIKRPVGENHGACSKVAEGILQRKADNKTHHAKTGDHWRDRHADLGQGDQHSHQEHDGAGNRDQHFFQQLRNRLIGVPQRPFGHAPC